VALQVRKTTTLLRAIATSLRYAIDDGGVQKARFVAPHDRHA
jgi:hypothetical protein